MKIDQSKKKSIIAMLAKQQANVKLVYFCIIKSIFLEKKTYARVLFSLIFILKITEKCDLSFLCACVSRFLEAMEYRDTLRERAFGRAICQVRAKFGHSARVNM